VTDSIELLESVQPAKTAILFECCFIKVYLLRDIFDNKSSWGDKGVVGLCQAEAEDGKQTN
jgi:hypothetical protein